MAVSSSFRNLNDRNLSESSATFENRSFTSSLSWASIFGGLFAALLGYWMLMSLGMGVGSFGLQVDKITGDGFQALSIGALSWTVVSCVIALAIGAYLCVRASGAQNSKSAVMQALVTTSFFFLVMAMLTTSVLLPTISKSLSAVGQATLSLADQPRIQNLMDDVTSDLNITAADRAAFVKSISARLVSNDESSLRAFIAKRSNLPPTEVNARVSQLQENFQRVSTEVANAIGKAIALAGLALFAALLLGSLSATGSSVLAARANRRAKN